MTRGLGGRSPANISHHLKGVDFPANKQTLIQQAQANHAEADVLDTIRSLPEKEYHTMADVMQGVGQVE